MTEADFREAFHRHKDVVHRFAYRMTGSASMADDVVQDCFVTYWRKPEKYDSGRGALRPFLLGIARNIVLKRRERDRRHEELSEAIDDDACVCGPFDLVAQERAEAVKQAVLLLPALQREVLILAEYEELSIAEISAATGAEAAAVKSRLHRARGNLRRMLEPLMPMEGEHHGTKR